MEQLRDQMEEEAEGRADAQRMLSKANSEMQVRLGGRTHECKILTTLYSTA